MNADLLKLVDKMAVRKKPRRRIENWPEILAASPARLQRKLPNKSLMGNFYSYIVLDAKKIK